MSSASSSPLRLFRRNKRNEPSLQILEPTKKSRRQATFRAQSPLKSTTTTTKAQLKSATTSTAQLKSTTTLKPTPVVVDAPTATTRSLELPPEVVTPIVATPKGVTQKETTSATLNVEPVVISNQEDKEEVKASKNNDIGNDNHNHKDNDNDDTSTASGVARVKEEKWGPVAKVAHKHGPHSSKKQKQLQQQQRHYYDDYPNDNLDNDQVDHHQLRNLTLGSDDENGPAFRDYEGTSVVVSQKHVVRRGRDSTRRSALSRDNTSQQPEPEPEKYVSRFAARKTTGFQARPLPQSTYRCASPPRPCRPLSPHRRNVPYDARSSVASSVGQSKLEDPRYQQYDFRGRSLKSRQQDKQDSSRHLQTNNNHSQRESSGRNSHNNSHNHQNGVRQSSRKHNMSSNNRQQAQQKQPQMQPPRRPASPSPSRRSVLNQEDLDAAPPFRDYGRQRYQPEYPDNVVPRRIAHEGRQQSSRASSLSSFSSIGRH